MKALLCCLLILCSFYVKSQDKKAPVQTKKDTTAKAEDKAPIKTISEAIKGCVVKPGLFTMYVDTVKGNWFMQLTRDQLDKEFIHFFHVENGSADAGWVKGDYGWEKVFKIRRYFDRIEFAEQNVNYYFDPANALSKSASADINEPIFYSEKIAGISKKGDTIVIAVDELYKSETLAQLTFNNPPGTGPTNPFNKGALNKDKSKIRAIKNYPKNTDAMVELVYENLAPTNFGSITATDPRFTTILVQHSILEMPQNDYQPRFEDPRIGYFHVEVTDQTSDDPAPYRDMIARWHLVKKNPGSAHSEPVEPIVYWMENTTPVNVRPIIKSAVERWNYAFEQAGFKNAVVVKQQPDDADWDAGDVRYNVIRWTAAPNIGSAWGPSFVNPRTGQILSADIMMDYVFIRGIQTEEKLYEIDTRSVAEWIREFDDEARAIQNQPHHRCAMQHGAVQNMMFGRYAGKALAFDDSEMSRLTEEILIEVLMHEVGHTLGLSHNYISSHLWNATDIHNRALTEKEGLTSSVMDYNLVNFALNKEDQGNYQSVVPGMYDKWAIEYAYSEALNDPAAEKARLDKILDRSTDDRLRFGNDADAMFSPAMGIDPRINVWDMSNDVLTYNEQRVQLCQKTMGKLMERLTEKGSSYHEMYIGYRITQSQYAGALRSVVRYIGGVQLDRSMHGQKADAVPFKPVAESEQKKALNMIINYGFSPEAFSVPADVYQHLQYQRRGWNFFGWTEDPKIMERISGYQSELLAHLLNPTVLRRLNNSSYYGNTYSVAEMMNDVTQGIFRQDLTTDVNTSRQNLQIIYVNGLIYGIKDGGYDNISRSAMLHQLNSILAMMKKNKSKNADTLAHREHIIFDIEQALEAD